MPYIIWAVFFFFFFSRVHYQLSNFCCVSIRRRQRRIVVALQPPILRSSHPLLISDFPISCFHLNWVEFFPFFYSFKFYWYLIQRLNWLPAMCCGRVHVKIRIFKHSFWYFLIAESFFVQSLTKKRLNKVIR